MSQTTPTIETARKPRPFPTRNDAWYWGGGVLAEDRDGGWWSLHCRSSPSGVSTYRVGAVANRRPGGPMAVASPGFPETLKNKHFVGRGLSGNGYAIYREADD